MHKQIEWFNDKRSYEMKQLIETADEIHVKNILKKIYS